MNKYINQCFPKPSPHASKYAITYIQKKIILISTKVTITLP